MKAYCVSGGIAPLVLSPRHWMEVSSQLHAPAALPQGKSPWYPLDSLSNAKILEGLAVTQVVLYHEFNPHFIY
jgi:hypothetical protein